MIYECIFFNKNSHKSSRIPFKIKKKKTNTNPSDNIREKSDIQAVASQHGTLFLGKTRVSETKNTKVFVVLVSAKIYLFDDFSKPYKVKLATLLMR